MIRGAALLGAFALALAVATQSAATPTVAGPDMRVILAERPAARLADYRLFANAEATAPSEGVVAYELATPLFSDYADKQRFVFLPRGVRARVGDDGAILFPVGAVLIKTFAYTGDAGVRKIETRLLIRQQQGWTANTYVWDAVGREARLAPAGGQIPIRVTTATGVRDITYAVPNRNQCKGCHSTDGALAPIGPSASHFSTAGGGTEESELARWQRLGLLERTPVPPPSARTLDASARAYLDINCAHCHNPRGPANTSGLDLRVEQDDPVRWGVRKRPIAAGRGAGDLNFAIDPGHPDRSILLHRMISDDPGVMMPELGRATKHDEGVELVRTWIAQMGPDGRPRRN
jgi:uncharacterized repeat protein (TIGR03806 family)